MKIDLPPPPPPIGSVDWDYWQQLARLHCLTLALERDPRLEGAANLAEAFFHYVSEGVNVFAEDSDA